jgi:hypothetical protein
MQTLKSFGCSFFYGSDLPEVIDYTDFVNSNKEHSKRLPVRETWPLLIAKNLKLKYECWAQAGQGNFKIYCDILANSHKDDQSIYLVNWTWIDRYDYINNQESWHTLRPANESDLEKFYYRHLHSQFQDMISSATYIVSAAEHLSSLNCPYIMTYMDYNLLAQVDPTWHDPRYLKVLTQKLQQILVNFDGKNFLDWSRDNNFKISSNWHPLGPAHQAAAEYWLPAVEKLL